MLIHCSEISQRFAHNHRNTPNCNAVEKCMTTFYLEKRVRMCIIHPDDKMSRLSVAAKSKAKNE